MLATATAELNQFKKKILKRNKILTQNKKKLIREQFELGMARFSEYQMANARRAPRFRELASSKARALLAAENQRASG